MNINVTNSNKSFSLVDYYPIKNTTNEIHIEKISKVFVTGTYIFYSISHYKYLSFYIIFLKLKKLQ